MSIVTLIEFEESLADQKLNEDIQSKKSKLVEKKEIYFEKKREERKKKFYKKCLIGIKQMLKSSAKNCEIWI